MEKLKIKSFNLVIFGGDGDLSKRKILPALYQRYIDGQLSTSFKILCIRRKESSTDFFEELKAFIPGNEEEKKTNFPKFSSRIQLITIPDATQASYLELKNVIKENSDWQKVFYFSVPSSAYGEICNALKASELIDKKSKVVLEKPLGFDLSSSKKINDTISTCFNEDQIFRIDHFSPA
jgi:glucose-6-phosphate 1-dehydrogenase